MQKCIIIGGVLGHLVMALGAGPAAAEGRNFVARLSPANVEVVSASAEGKATFRLSQDGKQLRFKLTARNLAVANQAHIHLTHEGLIETGLRIQQFQRAGQEQKDHGPAVVFLLKYTPKGVPGDGVVAEGVIRESSLVGPLKGQKFDQLIEIMDKGNAYVNIHTIKDFGTDKAFCCPTGIRGTIRPE